jgi:hypothetical protein
MENRNHKRNILQEEKVVHIHLLKSIEMRLLFQGVFFINIFFCLFIYSEQAEEQQTKATNLTPPQSYNRILLFFTQYTSFSTNYSFFFRRAQDAPLRKSSSSRLDLTPDEVRAMAAMKTTFERQQSSLQSQLPKVCVVFTEFQKCHTNNKQISHQLAKNFQDKANELIAEYLKQVESTLKQQSISTNKKKTNLFCSNCSTLVS